MRDRLSPVSGLRWPYAVSLATMLMLLVLRLTIGWHFFVEGSKHQLERGWSSEGFLKQAKGPLAPWYKSMLPSSQGWEDEFRGSAAAKDEPNWSQQVSQGWEDYRSQFSEHYGLNDAQDKESTNIVERRKGQLEEWLEGNRDALSSHAHEWQRLLDARHDPAAEDVPFKKKRIADKQAELNKEESGWLAQVQGIERDLKRDLQSLLTDDNPKQPFQYERSSLTKVDAAMKFGILAIGVCLILGLFTRLAAVLGAMFLLSVVMSQPFWIPEAGRTYDQLLEMLALSTLATTAVGRWCGLDFFIHYLLVRPCCSAKGKPDELKS